MRARRWVGLLVMLGLMGGILAEGQEAINIPKPLRDVITPREFGIQTADAGQLSLAFEGFIDTILLNVQIGGGPATMFLLNARWRGLDIYQLTGAGTMTLNSATATKEEFPWQMDVALGWDGFFFFNGNPVCTLHWLFAGGEDFLNGPATLTCVGENAAFAKHGILHWVPDYWGTEAESVLTARPLPLMGAPESAQPLRTP